MVSEIAGNLIIDNGKVLLIRRSSQRTVTSDGWDVPGGKVREDESPTEAAVRAAEDEIGVEVSLEKPFFSGEFEHSDTIYLWHGYIASAEGEPEEPEHGELEWFDASELDDLELAPNLVQILPALRRI